jgi:hypothetical protein
MAAYWSALNILKQVAGELGLVQPATITGLTDVQSVQLLSLLNSGGNELLMYYPWEQLVREWAFTTVVDQADYPMPDDYSYFRDMTQWDRTNHWPLLGPKTPQEWAFLKGSLVAALPRLRYRIADNLFKIYPTPTTGMSPASYDLALEYISCMWCLGADGVTEQSMIIADGDTPRYDPWLLIKFVKFKFYELKGLPVSGVQGDFMRVFTSLTGKDVGARILSLAPQLQNQYIGPWSIPDGSWNVTP